MDLANLANTPLQFSSSINLMLFLSLISFAPFFLISVTSFLRITIVFGMLRSALGTQQSPPNMVIVSLALFMTISIMSPVWNDINANAIKPYVNGKITQAKAIEIGSKPLREFMFKQTKETDLALFAQFSGSGTASINYYNIGANYIMVAIAVGGFFIIPSRYSFYWTILLVPLTTLVLLFFSKLFDFVHLPVFSLPFSFVVILFVYFMQMRTKITKLFLTPVQYYSPEINLYSFNNNKDRNTQFLYFPLYMPFWGKWTISQGHNGDYTHKGDWGNAFDFVINDEFHKTYKSNGMLCEDYYCYNKPVLAPADGFVEEIIDHIDDNEIGKVNTINNWGNTIIIRHLNGLYTQMSHLKKGSFKFTKGEFVKRGDLVAQCGNSGRSPEPHLHFQVQVSPLLGSKTLNYPFG
ncbi:MAG: urea transporter [Paludibacter sp.]